MAIYRTYKNYQVKQENQELQVKRQPNISPIQFNKDTFDLELPSKDPFLGNNWTAEVKQENNVSQQKQKIEIKKEEIKPVAKKWPQIEYFGFVKNREKSNPLCLLKIDGHQIHISKGQSHNGVVVVSAFKDSVYVVFDGEKKVVKK